MSLDDYKLKNPESRNLPKEILDMRYEAVENFRNKSLDQAKEARSKIIENEEKKKEETEKNNDEENNENEEKKDEKMEKLFE